MHKVINDRESYDGTLECLMHKKGTYYIGLNMLLVLKIGGTISFDPPIKYFHFLVF